MFSYNCSICFLLDFLLIIFINQTPYFALLLQVSQHRSELGPFKNLFVRTYFQLNKFGGAGGMHFYGTTELFIYIILLQLQQYLFVTVPFIILF